MRTNLIKIDFTTPTALNMDDQVSLRDVYTKLVERGGYTGTDPFNQWVRRKLEFYTEGVDYSSQKEKTRTGKGASGVQTTIEYYTTIQVAMEIAANGHGKVGHEMRQFMSSCVRKVVENNLDIPKDPIELAQMMLDTARKERDLRLVAESERDHAVKTKAQISDKKTATAMATASTVVKKLQVVEKKLGEAENFKTITGWMAVEPRLCTLGSEMQVGQMLSKFYKSNNLEVTKAPHPKWGTVNVYSKESIDQLLLTKLH